jgi:hypothetical protein
MSSAEKNGFRIWIGRWGFAVVVTLAVLVAVCVAWKVEVPSTVPDFALNAAAVYRVEVGAATFLGLYLVAMAFALALNNRGFSEIGVNGLKAQDITREIQGDAIQEHDQRLKMVWRFVKVLERSTDASANELRKRLEKLEELQSSELPPH